MPVSADRPWCCLPVSQTCPVFFHIYQPSGWYGPRGGLSGSALPYLPSLWASQDTFGQLKITLLKGSGLGPRGWSNCHEQRTTLDPRRICQGMICWVEREELKTPQDSAPCALRKTQKWPKFSFHFNFWLKLVSIFEISFGLDFPC